MESQERWLWKAEMNWDLNGGRSAISDMEKGQRGEASRWRDVPVCSTNTSPVQRELGSSRHKQNHPCLVSPCLLFWSALGFRRPSTSLGVPRGWASVRSKGRAHVYRQSVPFSWLLESSSSLQVRQKPSEALVLGDWKTQLKWLQLLLGKEKGAAWSRAAFWLCSRLPGTPVASAAASFQPTGTRLPHPQCWGCHCDHYADARVIWKNSRLPSFLYGCLLSLVLRKSGQ